jgi:hypothetical protein
MNTKPARTARPSIDARVAGWTEAALERAALYLDAADDPAAVLALGVRTVAAEQQVKDMHLLDQITDACHAAIALALLTHYRRAIRLDPHALADPACTAEAVKAALAELTPELRPDLARKAATKVAVYSTAF